MVLIPDSSAILAALSMRSLEAPMSIAEPTDGDIFLACLVSPTSAWQGGDHG
jgi:hypothetical protein